MQRLTNPVQLLVRLICAVAFLSLGLAHKPPQVLAAVVESASLQLPDGSYADLCIDDQGMRHPHDRAASCEVCLISGSVVLPAPGGEPWLLVAFASLDNTPIESVEMRVPRQTGQPRSRGPPQLS